MAQQAISIGTNPNDGTGDPLRTAFTKSNSNWNDLYARSANATDVFGMLPDGATAIDTALAAAVAAGVKTLVFDEGSSFYKLTSAFTMPSGFQIVAGRGRPTIQWVNVAASRMFLFSNSVGSRIKGITINGNKANTVADACIVFSGTTTQCSLEDVNFVNCPSATSGSIVLSGSGVTRSGVLNCQFDGCSGTTLALNGCVNCTAFGNEIRASGGFGISLTGAVSCDVMKNRCLGSQVEPIGMNRISNYNRILGNHCEGSVLDNGISVSGAWNTVVGNLCLGNAKAGIGIWGSNNTVTGNTLINNNFGNTAAFWAGIWVQSGFGGTGQWNTIVGNTFDDNQVAPTQNYGVRLHGSGYLQWASSQAGIVSGINYIFNGLNIYIASSSGTTGSTAPTHTSGTVSDGGVSWTYVDSFTTAVGTLWNHVADNIVRRFAISAYSDADNWQHSVLFSSTTTSLTITADGLVKARPL